MSYKIKCTNCHHSEKKSIISCSLCSKGLELENINKISINNQGRNIFVKYQCFYPKKIKEILKAYPNSPTPVIKLQGPQIFAKLDYCSFSASSKDREAFIEIAMARKLGYQGIAVASTGNMGAALASLCAMFKFPCFVFIPIDTSKTKIKQIKQYGATVKKIAGNYDDIVPMVKKYAKNNHLFLASLQAFRFEGYKTIAYEIFDVFGNHLPKNIIVPLGDGTTYVGIWKGFNDLITAGLIKKCPSLIGVQATQCPPIVKAFVNNTNIKTIQKPKTLAKAIKIGNPLDGEYALRVAKTTHGKMFSYTEEEILKGHKALLNLGINAEYASALTYCPVLFNHFNNSLLLITGSGFKN
jgi:threonine synthase